MSVVLEVLAWVAAVWLLYRLSRRPITGSRVEGTRSYAADKPAVAREAHGVSAFHSRTRP
jgi:hypothetical protein